MNGVPTVRLWSAKDCLYSGFCHRQMALANYIKSVYSLQSTVKANKGRIRVEYYSLAVRIFLCHCLDEL